MRGDLLTDLPHVVATMPGNGPLVVFHSWVAAYLNEEEQRSLARQVAGLGADRPVHHLYCESPFETPGLPTPSSCSKRRCVWPIRIRTGTGSAGGLKPLRCPAPRARRAGPVPGPRPR